MTFEEKAKLHAHLIARGGLSRGQMELVKQFRDKAQDAREKARAVFS